TFSTNASTSTIGASHIKIHGSISGYLSTRGTFSTTGATVTWSHPSVAFEPGEVITVTVTTGVQSAAGTAISTAYTWQFGVQTAVAPGVFSSVATVSVQTTPYSIAL